MSFVLFSHEAGQFSQKPFDLGMVVPSASQYQLSGMLEYASAAPSSTGGFGMATHVWPPTALRVTPMHS